MIFIYCASRHSRYLKNITFIESDELFVKMATLGTCDVNIKAPSKLPSVNNEDSCFVFSSNGRNYLQHCSEYY